MLLAPYANNVNIAYGKTVYLCQIIILKALL